MHTTHQHSEGCFRYLFEELEDAVVKFELVDSEPVLVDANDALSEVFGYESDSVVGEPLNELIVPEAKHEEAKQLDQRTGDGESNAALVERMTDEGERTFVYRSVPYKERYGFAIYSDITVELQRERHLDVLHRVLRHNLRNDLTVILGMATNIIETTDEERTREAAAKINQSASDLSQLSDEANTIQKVLAETAMIHPIELQSPVGDVIADCDTGFETAAITVEIQPELTVEANQKLQIVLRSLLDNAIRYNDSPEPQVTIAASAVDPTTVEIDVVDNGPGIPKSEQRIITDDEQITPLSHGSGLGLWLVKWIVEGYLTQGESPGLQAVIRNL